MKHSTLPTGPDLPPFWSEASYDYKNEDLGAFGHVTYGWTAQTDERAWHAYCVIAFKGERFEASFLTAAEAIEAVEQFIREQLGGGS